MLFSVMEKNKARWHLSRDLKKIRGKACGWIIFRRAYQRERAANAKALEVESAYSPDGGLCRME